MSARYSAWIRIGGRLERSQAERLIRAIREDHAQLDWDVPPFEPTCADDLLASRSDERLWLCRPKASCGEFDSIEITCCGLGLPYRRHTGAWCGSDALLVDWHPGLVEPLERRASNVDEDWVLVPESEVRRALAALIRGEIEIAATPLQRICPAIPEVPPLILV